MAPPHHKNFDLSNDSHAHGDTPSSTDLLYLGNYVEEVGKAIEERGGGFFCSVLLIEFGGEVSADEDQGGDGLAGDVEGVVADGGGLFEVALAGGGYGEGDLGLGDSHRRPDGAVGCSAFADDFVGVE